MKYRTIQGGLASSLVVFLVVAGCGRQEVLEVPMDSQHLAAVDAWRADRAKRLERPDGWLALVGLEWLEDGANVFGSAPDADLVLSAPGIPPQAGVLEVGDGNVTLRFDSGVEGRIDGEPAVEAPLLPDTHPEGPTMAELGRLSFYLIERGGRLGVRVKDPESPARVGFEGLDYFPTAPRWRVEARFVPYDPPRRIDVPNVLGTPTSEPVPGYLEFASDGRQHRLEPVAEAGDPLFIIFGDATNGGSTYGGGRFLYADPPDAAGKVVVDFNLAYNPPCVFTPYATCPLPPASNRLDLAIEAGEKSYSGH